MLLKLSKIKSGMLYRKPTIFFETNNKNKDNLILIPSLSEKTMIDVINSNLLREQNVRAIYTPFRITPMSRKRIVIPLKEYYNNIFSKTNSKLTMGRKNILAYSGRNLIYDFGTEWRHTIDLVSKLRGENPKSVNYLTNYLYDIMQKSIDEAGYMNNILVVPYDGSIDGFQAKVRRKVSTGDIDTLVDPAMIVTKSLLNYEPVMRNTIFKNIRFVVFYNTNADALIKIDLDELTPDNIDSHKKRDMIRVIKLYGLSGKGHVPFESDEIAPEYEEVEQDNTSKDIVNKEIEKTLSHTRKDRVDIKAETKFEEVVKKFYTDNKIKNVEVSPNSDPQDNIYSKLVEKIKEKIDDGEEDAEKIINDQEIKSNLTRYAGLKKKENKLLLRTEENNEREIEILYDEFKKLPEVDLDKQESIEDYVDVQAKKDIRIKELANTPISVLSKEYIDKQFRDDIINVASSLSNNNILPMTLHRLEFEDASDPNNQIYRLKLGYRVNINGTNRDLSANINIPKIVDNHFLYLNGNRWTVDNQLAFLPVTKTSPHSVKITTNYSILFIDRENGYLSRSIEQVLKLIDMRINDPKIQVKFGDNLEQYSKNNMSDIEYSEMCKSVYSIKGSGYDLKFNIDDMVSELKLDGVPDKYWKVPQELIPIGYQQFEGKPHILFLYKGKVWRKDANKDTLVKDSLSELIYDNIYGTKYEHLPDTGTRMGYTTVKMVGSTYPMILILGMIFGLKNVMTRNRMKFRFSRTKDPRKGYMEIKFKDGYLYYEETIENQLLMNGIHSAKPNAYNIDDFNGSIPYDDWIGTVKNISTSTKTHFKNTMRITLNILIDPITQEILTHQGAPTNILDLLLYSNRLLGDNNYRPLGNVLNYRLRNYEQIAGMLNQILVKAYIDFLNGYLRGNTRNTFDVPENSVVQALTKASSVNTYSALSPVLELETYSRTSQKGFMGLENDQSYSQAMREFNDNKLSVYAAGATAFGGSVGITRSLTYQPHVKGIRGYISEIEDINTVPDARILSASELLSPFLSRHADASRQSMTIGQFKHNMPLNKGSIRLWSSGIEKVVPGLLSSDFIFKARLEGTVTALDSKQDIVELTYIDNTKDYIDLSTSFIRNSANAFYTPNRLILRKKVGDKFAKDEIIAYNDVFFTEREKDRVELLVGTLSKIAIAPIDNSFEDSTIITKKLSEKGMSRVVIPEMVALTSTTKINKIKKIGDKVNETMPIIEYDDFGDNDIEGFLSSALSSRIEDSLDSMSSTKYPNYHGVIKDIEVYYNVDKSELNPTLLKLVNEYQGRYEKKMDVVGKDNVFKLKQKMPSQQDPGSKEDGMFYEGVLIKFYIQANVPMGIGDKLSFDTAYVQCAS